MRFRGVNATHATVLVAVTLLVLLALGLSSLDLSSRAAARSTVNAAFNEPEILNLPDPWTGEPRRFRRHRVLGDGHCFYRALACALSKFQECSQKEQSDGLHLVLRDNAVDALAKRNASEEFKSENIERVLIGSAHDSDPRARWAEDPEIAALSTFLNINFRIFETERNEWTAYYFNDTGQNVFLIHQGLHFDALQLIEDDTSE